tara:strand:+ start:12497 stop:12706 length:210 start_codon:yes stop_codon:yes gene_type:complete
MNTEKTEDLFKKTLNAHMKLTGDSVTKIAKLIKCHPNTIYHWLKGEKSLSLRVWDDINGYIISELNSRK